MARPKKVVTVSELADAYACDRSTLRNWVKYQGIPYEFMVLKVKRGQRCMTVDRAGEKAVEKLLVSRGYAKQ